MASSRKQLTFNIFRNKIETLYYSNLMVLGIDFLFLIGVIFEMSLPV